MGGGAHGANTEPESNVTHLGYLLIYLFTYSLTYYLVRTVAAIPRLSSALRRLASSESAAYLTSFSLAPSSSEQPVSSAVVQAPGY